MINILAKEQYDDLLKKRDTTFLESSTYGIASEIIGKNYLLFGILEQNQYVDCFLVLKEKLLLSKYDKFILFHPTIDQYLLSKEMKKQFKKMNGLFYTKLSNDGNVIHKMYHLELTNKLLQQFDSEVRTNINNAYTYPLELVDVNEKNIDVFCLLFKNKLNKKTIQDNLCNRDFQFKMVILNISEYIDSLLKQKNELMLKKAEEKMFDNMDDMTGIERKIEVIDLNINVLNQIKEKKGNILFLSAGIFFTYQDQFIEFYSVYDTELSELNAAYYLTFKMMKYALENGYREYFNMNINNHFHLEEILIHEGSKNIIRKLKYQLYIRKKEKKNA